MSTDYEWPPDETDAANEWASEKPFDAIAFAAGWTHTGQGYGPSQAREEWPDMPGFDFDEGIPEYASDIKNAKMRGYEYRTVLYAGDPYSSPPKTTADGWTIVGSFGINPEPSVSEDGEERLYINEGNREVVYRRWDADTYPGQAPEGHWTFIDTEDGEVYGPYPSEKLAKEDAKAFREEYPGTPTDTEFVSDPYFHPWDGGYNYFAYDPDED